MADRADPITRKVFMLGRKRVRAYTTAVGSAKKSRTKGYRGPIIPRLSLRNQGPLPDIQRASLRFSDIVSLDPTGSDNAATRVYGANWLFDPGDTSSAQQPMGWDQLIALYEYGIVLKSKITVWSPGGSNACFIGVGLSGLAGAGTSGRTVLEFRNSKVMALPSTGVTTVVPKISQSTDIMEFLGIKDPLTDPSLRNSDSANASNSVYWQLSCFGFSGTDIAAVPCRVLIEYDCVFTSPRAFDQSDQ